MVVLVVVVVVVVVVCDIYCVDSISGSGGSNNILVAVVYYN